MTSALQPARISTPDSVLVAVDKARRLLAQARSATDAKYILDMAHAAEVYAKRQRLAAETISYAHEIRITALALMGEFLAAAPKNTGARGIGKSVLVRDEHTPPTLEQLGIGYDESSQAQFLARLRRESPDIFQEIKSGQRTISEVIRGEVDGRAILSRGSNTEYYTPDNIIQAVRDVMGTIDLDVASCRLANTVVKATSFYDKESDGLKQPWNGNVWLNPPFSEWPAFAEKLLGELPHITQVCALVGAFSLNKKYVVPVLERADMICVVTGRLEFWGPAVEHGTGNGAAMGHLVVYFGNRTRIFAERFAELGVCLAPLDRQSKPGGYQR